MTLTFIISKGLNLIAFPYRRAQKHQKSHLFSLFHSKGPNLTLPKKDMAYQGFFEELDLQMLHNKFQGNRPSNSGEKGF